VSERLAGQGEDIGINYPDWTDYRKKLGFDPLKCSTAGSSSTRHSCSALATSQFSVPNTHTLILRLTT